MPKPVTAKDYMSANLVTFTPDMDILKAINLLIENRISGAPVVDKQGNMVGMLAEKECLKVALQASYHSESAGTVAEYMRTEMKTVDADTNIVDIAGMFLQDGYRRYPVMKDNRLVGQISRRDVLRAMEALWD
jgi:predicted transcriptional regulator